MVIFWGSAIGGIAFAVTWARSKSRNPVNRELLLKSLKQRLEKGEIDEEQYRQKISQLETEEQERKPGS